MNVQCIKATIIKVPGNRANMSIEIIHVFFDPEAAWTRTSEKDNYMSARKGRILRDGRGLWCAWGWRSCTGSPPARGSGTSSCTPPPPGGNLRREGASRRRAATTLPLFPPQRLPRLSPPSCFDWTHRIAPKSSDPQMAPFKPASLSVLIGFIFVESNLHWNKFTGKPPTLRWL